jgi:hypothetical protein
VRNASANGTIEDFGTVLSSGSLVDGIRSLDELPEGEIRCRDCNGDQEPWLEDYGRVCDTCSGLGHHKDKDYEGGSSDDFDPISESTMPRLWGRGRGQL